MSEEKWIAILENTAGAPWLSSLPPELENRLKLAYTLLFQIVLYLGRPMDPEKADQFLVVSISTTSYLLTFFIYIACLRLLDQRLCHRTLR